MRWSFFPRRHSMRLAGAAGALFLSLAGTAAAGVMTGGERAERASAGPTAADPKLGAFFGRSADGLPAFLHVTAFGLRDRLRTAAIGTKATCISTGATGTQIARISVVGRNILVGRDGRFSYRRTFTENDTVTTYRIRGSFTTPSTATGTASVTTLTQGDGLATVTCDSRTKRFTVRLR